MAYFALAIFLLLSTSANASTVFDMGEHSGIIRDSNGNFSKVSANGSVRTLTSNTALALVEKPIINTSKGFLEVQLSRSAPVDLTGSRLGKAVATFAKRVGPVSMALATVDLICSLASICNQGGSWLTTIRETLPPGTSDGWRCSNATSMTATIDSCKANYYGCNNPARLCSEDQVIDGGTGYKFKISERASGFVNGYADLVRVNPWVGAPISTAPTTDSHWSSAESKLTDARFTPELFNAGESIPVGTPTLTGSPVNVPMGSTTKTIKDGSGTVTGTETAATSLSITDGATSTTPNIINITETTINTTYNNSNLVTGTTTTTSDPTQPAKDTKVDPLEIKFDTVNDTPLTEKVVTAPFTTTSWGSGECPPDIAMNLTRGNYSIDSQPFCDLSIALKPVLLLIASLAGAYIVITSTRPTAS